MIKNKSFKIRHTIKIPNDVTVIYCNITNLLIFKGLVTSKTIKLSLKIIHVPSLNIIGVTQIPVHKVSKNNKKHLKKLQGTTIAKIKQYLIETSNVLYCKLNLVGVGYRAFNLDELNNQICLKLGYSHLIYHKVPTNLSAFCVKFTKLFIFGLGSYETIKQTAASIRSCKTPEPYKGKGILYDKEKIHIKKGKKI